MAAPSDPLSHQLQHQHSAHNNANPNRNTSPWGTWEELILGSAVLKHGADNWALVSQELQTRARASFSFTPEACRAGYHAIRLRFGADAGRDGGSNQWYEELRRLRVAHLKRELEQYDSSIGTLRSKIRRLQSEGESSSGAQSSGAQPQGSEHKEVPYEPTLKGHTDESVACGSKRPCNNMAVTSQEAQVEGSIDPEGGLMGATTSHVGAHCTVDIGSKTPDPTTASLTGVDTAFACMKQSNGLEKGMHDEATGSLSKQCNGVKEVAVNGNVSSSYIKQEDQLPSSGSTLYLSMSKSDTTTSKSMNMELEKLNRDPVNSLNIKQEGPDIESRSGEIHARSRHDIVSDNLATGTLVKNFNHTLTINRASDDCAEPAMVGHTRLALQPDASVKVGHTRRAEASTKQGVSPSLKSVNIDECKNLTRSPFTDDDDGERKSDESQSLCSPRLKFQHVKRRRSGDGSGPAFKREVFSQDDLDDKRYVRKSLGEKSFVETMSNLPVESADSTEGKGQRALAMKAASPDALAGRIKKEMVMCKEEIEIMPRSNTARVEKDISKKLGVTPINIQKKNQSSSSTENSLLHEVWGESAEVVTKEMKPVSKRRRLMGRVDRKHKPTGSGDARAGTNTATKASSMKTDSLSHEASESMQSPGGKEEPDTEAWQQAERLSGDSRFEKSEVGSYVDGNEDVSPMSRRNRREPKVSGKHIPLLESLRTICAHRCGHFFRHNQEPEDNDLYYRIVRSPIDLGMIRAKLEEGHYTGSVHFFRDLLLMVSNAMVYYPRDSSESAAASGLRECVMKEMVHVFETEALVKQEGPSFRKRDSRQLPGQGRRKGGLKLLSTTERTSRERDRSVKQSDVSTSNESRRMSHQSFAKRLCEGARPDKGTDAKRTVHIGADVHKNLENSECKKLTSNQTTPEVLSSLKTGQSPLDKANEVKESPMRSFAPGKGGEGKEPGSSKSPTHTPRDSKLKDRSSEDVVEKKPGSGNVGSTSKTLVTTSYKGKESANYKAKAVPSAGQEPPVKRGVGRPPKHSQQQGMLKAREVLEVSNSTRKRGRR